MDRKPGVKWVRSLAALVLLGVGAGAAHAACYDVFGCTNRNVFRFDDLASGPNCDFLYTMRNGVYQEHGYCFQTPRGRQTLGNQACNTSNQAEATARFNGIENTNVATIKRVEQYKHCPL